MSWSINDVEGKYAYHEILNDNNYEEVSSSDEGVSTVAQERLRWVNDLNLEHYKIKSSITWPWNYVDFTLQNTILIRGVRKQIFHDEISNPKALMKIMLSNLMNVYSGSETEKLSDTSRCSWPNNRSMYALGEQEHKLLCYLADLTLRIQEIEVSKSQKVDYGQPLTFVELEYLTNLFPNFFGENMYRAICRSKNHMYEYMKLFRNGNSIKFNVIKDKERLERRKKNLGYYIGIAKRIRQVRVIPFFGDDGWLSKQYDHNTYSNLRYFCEQNQITERFIYSDEFKIENANLLALPGRTPKILWRHMFLWLKNQNKTDILKGIGANFQERKREDKISYDPKLVSFLESNNFDQLHTQMILDHLMDREIDTFELFKEKDVQELFEELDVPVRFIDKLEQALNENK